MISVSSNLIPISDVPQYLPPKHGKRVHISAVYRWMMKGIRGVKLEYLCIGGFRYTSFESLQQFAELVTKARGNDPVVLSSHSRIREKQIGLAKKRVDLMLRSRKTV